MVLVVALPLLAIVLSPLSMIIGVEFSPDTFYQRQFFYLRVPGTQIALTQRTVNEMASFSRTLVDDRWVQEIRSGEARWDLVMDNFTPKHSPDCDAQLLVQELDRRNAEFEYVWSKWSDKYPQRAKVLWPIVADFARHQMYLYLSDIFEFCRREDRLPDDQFADQLKILASQQCYYRAQVPSQSSPTPEQIQSAQRSLGYHPLPESLALLQRWSVDPKPIAPPVPAELGTAPLESIQAEDSGD